MPTPHRPLIPKYINKQLWFQMNKMSMMRKVLL